MMHRQIILLVLLASTAAGQTTQPKPPGTPSTVVFVCDHGSAKSVIAAAHFNRLASERGLPYRAVSRGTTPDVAVAPGVRRGLASDGIDVSGWHPQAVTDQATKPFAKDKLLEWNDIPSVTQNYDAARTAIVEQVRKLVESLSASRKR